MSVEYKAELNEKYGDWRVHEYINGEWNNGRDNNWSQGFAENKAKKLNEFVEANNIESSLFDIPR